jgi:hypothetical protein
MATYEELKAFIRTIHSSTEMMVGDEVMKGDRLKSFLVSKLTHPHLVDLATEPETTIKPEIKANTQPHKKTKTKAKELTHSETTKSE